MHERREMCVSQCLDAAAVVGEQGLGMGLSQRICVCVYAYVMTIGIYTRLGLVSHNRYQSITASTPLSEDIMDGVRICAVT